MPGSEEVDRAFGERVRLERERQGISQGALAANLLIMHDIGLHQTAISKIESGERPARLHEAVAIANLLDVTLDELAGGAGAVDTAKAVTELEAVGQFVADRLERLRAADRDVVYPDVQATPDR